MLNQELTDRIRRLKLEALAAIHLHEQRIQLLQKRNLFVELLSITVPVFYITPRFLAKGTTVAPVIDALGEILSAVLLVLAIAKLLYKWQDREIKHGIMARRNSDVSREADRLLSKQTSASEVDQFLRRIQDIDDEDRDLLLGVREEENQVAYREALKRVQAGGDSCFKCGADTWNFQPGSCKVCGGTPINFSKKNRS